MTTYPAIVLEVDAPLSATEGSTIAVSVTGLAPGEAFTIVIGTAVLHSGSAPAAGPLAANVPLGSTARGPHSLVATGQAADRTGSTPLTVNPASGNPTKRKG
jgi:hypothetical protein